MKRLIAFLLVLVMCIACAACSNTPSETPNSNIPAATQPSESQPTESNPETTNPQPSTPEESKPDATEPETSEPETEPEEPTEVVYEVLKLQEVSSKVEGFTFGEDPVLKAIYVWYTEYNFVEAQLKDGDQMYYARVMKTDVLSDIACWKIDWAQPFTKTYDAIPELEGIIRRATVDGVQYTNVLWYDKDTGCTYSLDWQGGGEIPSWPAWIFNKKECPQVSLG